MKYDCVSAVVYNTAVLAAGCGGSDDDVSSVVAWFICCEVD